MIQIGGELETAQHLNKYIDCFHAAEVYWLTYRVRKEMEESDRRQEAQIEEIKGRSDLLSSQFPAVANVIQVLLENALQHEILEHIQTLSKH